MLVALQLAAALTLSAPKAKPPVDPAVRTITKAAVYLALEPSFLAKRVTEVALQRATKVRLEAEPKGAWYYVSHKPKSGKKLLGYLHASYISDRPAAFKVDPKNVSNQGLVSGNLNLAVPGFREEVAKKRERKRTDAKRGYAAISRHMPLLINGRNSAKLAWPADPEVMAAFALEGRLRDPAGASAAVAHTSGSAPDLTPTGAPGPASAPSDWAAPPLLPVAPQDADAPLQPVPQPSGPPSDPSEWSWP